MRIVSDGLADFDPEAQQIQTCGARVLCTITGDVDDTACEELDQLLHALFQAHPVEVILDFAWVNIRSDQLTVVLVRRRRQAESCGARLSLISPRTETKEVMDEISASAQFHHKYTSIGAALAA